jgi:eight-cysteine-cluster-containing protein
MRNVAVVLLLVGLGVLFSGCAMPGRNEVPVPTGGFCGTSTNGQCSADSDCMKGGCSGQVCQSKADPSAVTTCEYRDCYDANTYSLVCGCVSGGCQWKGTQYNVEQVGK